MAHARFWKWAAVAGTGLLLATTAVKAEDGLDGTAFQKIIKNQMSAFASGNAKAAFSFATNSLQQRFQTPEFFMEMVRQGYQPVYQPKSVTFGQSKMTKLWTDPGSLCDRAKGQELAGALQFRTAVRWQLAHFRVLPDQIARLFRLTPPSGRYGPPPQRAAMSPRAQFSLVSA